MKQKIVYTVLLMWLNLLLIQPVWSAAPEQAQQLIQGISQKMQQALLQNQSQLRHDSSQIYDLVDDILLPHIDFEIIAQLVLGKHWPKASSEQKQKFIEEFRTLMVRTYAKALLEYADSELHYPPLRQSSKEQRVNVRVDVQLASGQKVPIDYTMCDRNGAWKVCNIVIDRSINFVINYRKQIDDQVRSQGLDQVIAQLSERNAKGL